MTLEELINNKAIQEKYDEAYIHVIDNMADDNTKPTTKRKITLDIIFKQDEEREIVDIDIAVKETLAPRILKSKAFVSDRQLPGQANIDDYLEEEPSKAAELDMSRYMKNS